MGKLDNKVAIVTGGSRGIGAASALALADEGANVAISYTGKIDSAMSDKHGLSGVFASDAGGSSDAGAAWRDSFKAAPLLRERLILLGVLAGLRVLKRWRRMLDDYPEYPRVSKDDGLVRLGWSAPIGLPVVFLLAWLYLLAVGLQAGKQAGDFADGGPYRCQHVALELRIVGVNLGIGEKHRKLPGHILDVMNDESETLAVFAKLLGLCQDLHGALFRHTARDFATNHS